MYLISPDQIKRLQETHANAYRPTIRDKAADELDSEMRRVLETQGLTSDEKIKKYNMLLQKYLVLERQKSDESREITLRLPGEREVVETERSHDYQQEEASQEGEQTGSVNKVLQDVLSHINPRSKRNTEYLMHRILASKGPGGWTEDGEFMHRQKPIPGSHMLDLMKFLASSRASVKPTGWSLLAQTLADLKIPLSTITNLSARREITAIKESRETGEYRRSSDEDVIVKKKKKRKRIALSPTWLSF